MASSTVVAEGAEATGFVVSYVARVKLNLGSMGGELVADVPFKLMHPTPGKMFQKTVPAALLTAVPGAKGQAKAGYEKPERTEQRGVHYQSNSGGRYESSYARDDEDENIVFEDFARLRST